MNKLLIACFCLSLSAAAWAADAPSRAVQQGMDKGFKTCAGALDILVKSANEDDTKYGHLGVWSVAAVDSHVFDTTTIQPFSDGTQIVAYSAVRSAEGKCDLTMTQILPVTKSSCTTLRESIFKDWKFLQDLGGVPLYERADSPSLTVLLSPLSANGCLIVKRYVAFGQ